MWGGPTRPVVNAATGRHANQLDTYSKGVAARATDGIASGVYAFGSVARTASGLAHGERDAVADAPIFGGQRQRFAGPAIVTANGPIVEIALLADCRIGGCHCGGEKGEDG